MSNVFTQRIHEEIRARLITEGVPFQCVIPDLCIIASRERSSGFGGVGGMRLSSAAIFRRILSNGFERAAVQLPKGHAGLVAVFSKHLPDYHFAKLVFDTLMESMASDYEHVAGMVIFTQQYIGAQRRVPYFLQNGRCKYPQGFARIAETIRRQLDIS